MTQNSAKQDCGSTHGLAGRPDERQRREEALPPRDLFHRGGLRKRSHG
jgi:hypothetical protein